jgi:hypothetical protein
MKYDATKTNCTDVDTHEVTLALLKAAAKLCRFCGNALEVA